MSWYIVESPGLKPDWFFDSKLSVLKCDSKLSRVKDVGEGIMK